MANPRVVVGCLGAVLLASVSAAQDLPERTFDAESRAAIEACVANIERFQQYVCKYDLTAAKAATFEDALAGKYTNIEGVATGMLARDGEFFTVAIDAEDAKNLKSPVQPGPGGLWGQSSLGFSTTRMFRTKTRVMHHSGIGASIHLEPGKSFDVHAPIKAQLVSSLLETRPDSSQVVAQSDPDRANVTVVEHRRPPRDGFPATKVVFEFDRSRNGLFQKSVTPREDPLQPSVLEVLQAEEHDGAWFPTRVLFRYRLKGTDGWIVRDIQVTELKVGPDSGSLAALRRTMKKGTQVNTHPYVQGSFFTLQADTEISPADIEELIRKCEQRAKALAESEVSADGTPPSK
jgi:hypothetical protein